MALCHTFHHINFEENRINSGENSVLLLLFWRSSWKNTFFGIITKISYMNYSLDYIDCIPLAPEKPGGAPAMGLSTSVLKCGYVADDWLLRRTL